MVYRVSGTHCNRIAHIPCRFCGKYLAIKLPDSYDFYQDSLVVQCDVCKAISEINTTPPVGISYDAWMKVTYENDEGEDKLWQ